MAPILWFITLLKKKKNKQFKNVARKPLISLLSQTEIDEETYLPNRFALFASKYEEIKICLIDIRYFSMIVHSYKSEMVDAILLDFFSTAMQYAEMYGCKTYRYDVDIVAIAGDLSKIDSIRFEYMVKCIQKNMEFYTFDASPYSLGDYTVGISTIIATSSHSSVRSAILSAEKNLIASKRYSFISGSKDYPSLYSQAMLFHNALLNDKTFLIIQPIMDCDTGYIVRYEALIRIRDGDHVITPANFLDGVYAFGLSHILFLWVFNEIMIKSVGREISINILPSNIMCEEVRNSIYAAFMKEPHKASKITFEMLEVQNDGEVSIISEFINKVRDFGAKIAIDDFGTGYSNFRRAFWEWNVDFIKIDGSFVQRAKYDHKARSIITTIVKMAKDNDILTIAEFVSDEDIFKIMIDCNVDYVQGYYISAGVPLDLANNPSHPSLPIDSAI